MWISLNSKTIVIQGRSLANYKTRFYTRKCLYQCRNTKVVVHSIDVFQHLPFDYGIFVLNFPWSLVFFMILHFFMLYRHFESLAVPVDVCLLLIFHHLSLTFIVVYFFSVVSILYYSYDFLIRDSCMYHYICILQIWFLSSRC